PLQPKHPLFPYTTLFRSLEDVIERTIEGLRPQVEARVGPDQLNRDAYRVAGFAYAAFEHVGDVQRPRNIGNRRLLALEVETGGADRKSTRLNSSHVAISY